MKESDSTKKSVRVAIVSGVIAVVFFAREILMAIVLFVFIGVGHLLVPGPPRPAVRYGEFPFRVVYEVNGETLTIEDTVICEYAGVESRGIGTKIRTWTSRLKSGSDLVVLLKTESEDLIQEV